MATADTSNTIADWPQEGTSVSETYERAPAANEFITARANARRSRGLEEAEYWSRACQDSLHKCGQWIHDCLESGALVLKAYRSEELWGEPVTFDRLVARNLSPDESGEIVRGPNGEIFYSPRFYAAATMARKPKPDPIQVELIKRTSGQATAAKQSEAPPQTVTIRSNKEWLEWAKQNILPDDADWGWKNRYAQKLVGRMKADAKNNKKIEPLPLTSIAARMREIGWPEIDDETTTK
jgi:hypothetical protein